MPDTEAPQSQPTGSASTSLPARQHPGAWTCIGRALKLKCPECGISAVFKPMRETRNLDDWFRTLDGCPRCGYAYERESGYWLIAIWAVNYGLIAGLGMIIALIVEAIWSPPLWVTFAIIVIPMPILSFLFARHAKALYLAMDHYFDPHLK